MDGREASSSDGEVRLRVYHATDAGGVRPKNEDCYAVPPFGNLTPSPPRLNQAHYDHRGVLYVVADGMGGALAGEVASQLAVRTLVESYYQDADEDLQRALWRAFDKANRAVYRLSLSRPQYQGMGTTLTAMVLHGNKAYWANVGDSRLYRARRGHLTRITKDHTMVQELVDKGVLNLEEARLHPQRNELKRALGTQGDVDIDVGRIDLEVGDLFLLSTDGLHDELSDAQIRDTLLRDPAAAPRALILEAMQPHGGPDNITAVVVGVPAEGIVVPPSPGIDWGRALKQAAVSLTVIAAVLAFVRYGGPLLGVTGGESLVQQSSHVVPTGEATSELVPVTPLPMTASPEATDTAAPTNTATTTPDPGGWQLFPLLSSTTPAPRITPVPTSSTPAPRQPVDDDDDDEPRVVATSSRATISPPPTDPPRITAEASVAAPPTPRSANTPEPPPAPPEPREPDPYP